MNNLSLAKSLKSEIMMRKQGKILPSSAFIEVTHKCNLSCLHCYLQDMPREAELNTNEYKKIFKQLRNGGVLFLTFTGGEMFCRTDIFEIIEAARGAGLFYSFITNGTLIDKGNIKEIKASNPLGVSISLYGANARTHDSITSRVGSFEKSIASLMMLSERGIKTIIKTTVMNKNYEEIDQIQDLADRAGARFSPDPIIVPAINGADEHLSQRLSFERFKEFAIMRNWSFDSKGREIDDNSNFLVCSAARSKLVIAPSGEVYPCAIWRVPAGSFINRSFEDIWESQLFKTIRSTKDVDLKECSTCNSSHLCTRCPGLAHLENMDFLGLSSEVCRMTSVVSEVMKYGEKDLSSSANGND